MFESVLLPAPFSPRRACTSPRVTSKSTASFASTAGKRFVIPRMETAGEAPGSPAPLAAPGTLGACPKALAGRRNLRDGADHALDQPLHRVEVRQHLQALALRHHQLAALVVQRALEHGELAG